MKDDTFQIVAGLTVVVIALSLWALQPLFEAKAYNKFTDGPKATYWDAMWTNLRVTSQ